MDYNEKVAELEARFNQVEQCKKRIDALVVKLGEMNSELAVMLEAQQILRQCYLISQASLTRH